MYTLSSSAPIYTDPFTPNLSHSLSTLSMPPPPPHVHTPLYTPLHPGALRCLDAPDEAARRGLRFFAYSLHTYDIASDSNTSGDNNTASDNNIASDNNTSSDISSRDIVTSATVHDKATINKTTTDAKTAIASTINGNTCGSVSADLVADGKVHCRVLSSQSATLTHLAAMGFQVAPGWVECPLPALWPAVLAFETTRAALGFGTDGAVIKINSQAVQGLLGDGSRAPKWAVAYKFTAEEGETDLLDITVQVGRLL